MSKNEPEQPGGLGEIIRTWGPAILVVVVIRSMLASPFRIPSGSMVPTLEIGDHILVSKLSYGLHIPWIDLDAGPGFWLFPFTTIEVASWDEPERGDVVVFKYPPDPATDYIKRVVGLPGDTIEVVENTLFVNGQEASKEYLDEYSFVDDGCRSWETLRYREDLLGVEHDILTRRGATALSDYGPVTVPEGHYFMMGDNRDNSSDSRVWRFVPREYIRGRALFVWLSLDSCADGSGGVAREPSLLNALMSGGVLRTDRIGHKIE
jgi:signal peptidase I